MGDLVFVGSCNGVLHAFDRHKGNRRWTYNAAADGGKPEFHGRPLVTTDLIVVASDDRRPEGIGYVYAFNRSSLDLLWKYRAGSGAMTDIVAAKGTAYVVTLSDEVIALDLRSGVVRWKFAGGTSNERFFANSSPTITAGRLIFGELDGTVSALDAETGRLLWRRELGARVSTSIVAVGNYLYAGDATGRIHKLNAATGAIQAQLRIGESANFRIVIAGESLLVFTIEADTPILKSVALSLQSVRWTQGAPPSGWSSFGLPYVWKDWVIAGKETGEVVALRLADGHPEWDGKVKGSIAGIGGDETSLYLGTTGGTLYSYPLSVGRRRPQ